MLRRDRQRPRARVPLDALARVNAGRELGRALRRPLRTTTRGTGRPIRAGAIDLILAGLGEPATLVGRSTSGAGTGISLALLRAARRACRSASKPNAGMRAEADASRARRPATAPCTRQRSATRRSGARHGLPSLSLVLRCVPSARVARGTPASRAAGSRSCGISSSRDGRLHGRRLARCSTRFCRSAPRSRASATTA